jgi:hypothetical protein
MYSHIPQYALNPCLSPSIPQLGAWMFQISDIDLRPKLSSVTMNFFISLVTPYSFPKWTDVLVRDTTKICEQHMLRNSSMISTF